MESILGLPWARFRELPGRAFPVKQLTTNEGEWGGKVGGEWGGAGEIRTEIGPSHYNLAPG